MVVPAWAAVALLVSFALSSAGLAVALRMALRPRSVRARLAPYTAGVTLQVPATSSAPRWQAALRERQRMRRWSALAGWHRRMATELLAADLPLRPIEFQGLRIALGLALALLLVARTGNPLIAVAGLGAGVLVPRWWLRRRQVRRRHRIEGQLADALDLIANAVRSGQSFTRGLRLVADEMPAPIRNEAATTLAELHVGGSLGQALENLAKRNRIYDVNLVVAAVQIHQSIGGDLGEVLHNISSTVRERARIKAEVRALTAQGRLSGWVIGMLPIFLATGLSLLNPEYMQPLFVEPLGRLLLGSAAVFWVVGFIVMRRMVSIDF